MKRVRDAIQKYQNSHLSNYGQVVFLFLISLLAHGLFIPWLGFYGDDWSLLWLSYKAGSTSLFFPSNRFLLPYIYSFFIYLLNPSTWIWHSFLFIIHFLSVVNLWYLLKTLWPNKKLIWVWISLLFALYPGSLITYQPMTYWVVYLQFCILLASFWLMLVAVDKDSNRWIFIILGVFFATLNLLLSEYLFFLELLRIPILITYFVNRKLDFKDSKKLILKISIPYLIVFLSLSISRLINNQNASSYYDIDLTKYFSHPFQTIQFFINKMVVDGIKSGFLTWIKPLRDSILFEFSGSRSILLFSFIACFTTLIIFFSITFFINKGEEKNISLKTIPLGVIGLIFAGAPFWIAELPIDIGISNYSRFSIPAAFGSAFLIYGIVTLLLKNRLFSNIILSVICGFAVMMHLLSGNYFRNIWELQNRFFWEFAWRIPALEPGTTFFSNELPLQTMGENSISAAINWIYMEISFPINHIDYYSYDSKDRFFNEFPQEKDIPIKRSHMAGVFIGNSSNLITFWYQPPACLHIINENWDKFNPDIPLYLREIDLYNPKGLIQPRGNSEINLKKSPIFLDEDQNNFCYYYQKAALAAENNNWDEVSDLWNASLSYKLKPNNASERLPFIQGLAHMNRYEESFALSLEITDISKSYEPLLCQFWNQLSEDDSLDNKVISEFIDHKLSCDEKLQ